MVQPSLLFRSGYSSPAHTPRPTRRRSWPPSPCSPPVLGSEHTNEDLSAHRSEPMVAAIEMGPPSTELGPITSGNSGNRARKPTGTSCWSPPSAERNEATTPGSQLRVRLHFRCILHSYLPAAHITTPNGRFCFSVKKMLLISLKRHVTQLTLPGTHSPTCIAFSGRQRAPQTAQPECPPAQWCANILAGTLLFCGGFQYFTASSL